MHFNISVLFVVDTTSILKLVFPTAYCSCLDGHLDCCVVAIIVAVVLAVCFIYLFIYLFFSDVSTIIFIFVVVFFITTVAFVVGVIVASFYVWLLLLLIQCSMSLETVDTPISNYKTSNKA